MNIAAVEGFSGGWRTRDTSPDKETDRCIFYLYYCRLKLRFFLTNDRSMLVVSAKFLKVAFGAQFSANLKRFPLLLLLLLFENEVPIFKTSILRTRLFF
jgi:hypothetical protein